MTSPTPTQVAMLGDLLRKAVYPYQIWRYLLLQRVDAQPIPGLGGFALVAKIKLNQLWILVGYQPATKKTPKRHLFCLSRTGNWIGETTFTDWSGYWAAQVALKMLAHWSSPPRPKHIADLNARSHEPLPITV